MAFQARKRFALTECPICFAIPVKMRSTPPCDHAYCYKCLRQLVEQKDPDVSCKVCGEPFDSFQYKNGTRTFTKPSLKPNHQSNPSKRKKKAQQKSAEVLLIITCIPLFQFKLIFFLSVCRMMILQML